MPDTDNNKKTSLKDIIPGAEEVHLYLKRFARSRRHERIDLLIDRAIAACLLILGILIVDGRWLFLAYDLALLVLLTWLLFLRIQKPVPKKPLGLLPYEDGELFARLGRHNEIDGCINLIKAPDAPIIVVHGPPGSGKTSVLLSGIRFKLEHSNAATTQSTQPKCIYWSAARDGSASSLVAEIERSTGVVCHGDLKVLLKSASKPIVLLIDQFERLRSSNHLQQPIFDFIHEIGRQDSQIKLVIALRTEYLEQWVAFEREASILAPRITVNPFPIPRAVAIMREVLENAHISVSSAVLKKFVSDMGDERGVSPVAIALGASIFWKWHEAVGKIRSQDYISAGGSRAVLREHLREQFNPDSIDTEESVLLIRALVTALDETEIGVTKKRTASLHSIEGDTNLNAERLRLYLGQLEVGRIINKNATDETYIIADQRFVTLLKELDRDSPSRPDQSIATHYLQWLGDHKRRYLLRKKDIRRVLADPGILIAPPDEFQKAHYIGLSRRALRQKQFVLTCLIVVILVGGLFGSKVYAIYRLHQELKRFSLPSDLYDRQHGLESLVIIKPAPDDQGPKLDLDWLDSDSLTDLAISAPQLHSIEGISRIQGLQAVDVDLNKTSTQSLHSFSSLHEVRKLVLRNVGNAKSRLIPEIGPLPKLTDLLLDLHNSAIGSLPKVITSPELKHLTLDLRFTGMVRLPDLSQLQQLSTVHLFIDGSGISDLSPLARIPQLQALTLSLDGTQTHLLSGLNNSQPLQSLTLSFSSPFDGLPDLRGIHQLTSLSLYMPGARGGIPDRTPVPDLQQLNNLKGLEVFLNGSDVDSLPPVERLSRLERLRFDLQGSAVKKLPNLSQLHKLQDITLNLNNTAISSLPDFAQFRKLTDLDLSVAYTNIKGLHDIEKLHTLGTLSLDLRGIESPDISWIAKIATLDTLRLRIRWSQVGDMPNLCALTNLHSLDLDLDDWWNKEELPKLSCLAPLRQLTLGLRNSHISALPDLSNLKHLTKLTLNLDNSDIQDLSSLETLTSLEELCLDIRRSEMRVLPNLTGLQKLRKVSADIGKSGISIRQTVSLGALKQLELDESCPSVGELPQTIKKLVFLLGEKAPVSLGSICERDSQAP